MNTHTVVVYGQSSLLSGEAAGLVARPTRQAARAAAWADASHLLIRNLRAEALQTIWKGQ